MATRKSTGAKRGTKGGATKGGATKAKGANATKGGARRGAAKGRSTRGPAAPAPTVTESAVLATMEAARAAATQVADARRRELRRRATARARASAGERSALLAAEAAAVPTAEALDALDPALRDVFGMRAAAGVLIAEGDSWFDYPMTDVLEELEDAFDYRVQSVAHMGDRVESMAYGEGQLEKFSRAIERAIRDGAIPRAILLSGGGNDIAGDELEMLLDHSSASSRRLNEDVVRGVIDGRVRLAYVHILGKVTQLCRDLLGRPLPIVLHGYDYPNPDGRGFGFLNGGGLLPGPWLEPAFRQKGYEDRDERLDIMEQLIDRFNAMLASLPAVTGYTHVRYVDLRGTLPNRVDHKKWWANELHPTRRGFAAVARKIAERIAEAI